MNPYPLALLNHFTVPFKRSTYAPLGHGSSLSMPPDYCHFPATEETLSREEIDKNTLFGLGSTPQFLTEPENARDGLAIMNASG
ncbi:MAG: hypothetical protein WAL84_15560, partial [Candidatus Dormiibacterota bacterium]